MKKYVFLILIIIIISFQTFLGVWPVCEVFISVQRL